jgi:hypothetical protein
VLNCTYSPKKEKNLIDNGSFEDDKVDVNWWADGWESFDKIKKWKSLNDEPFEIWGAGLFAGVPAVDGDHFLELDSNQGSKLDYIYQDIKTKKNQQYEASFYIRARKAFNSESETAIFSWNGVESSHRAEKAGVWTKIKVIVTGTGEEDRFAIRESSAVGANNGFGPFIDDVRLVAVTCV